MTLDALGRAMGAKPEVARGVAHQFLKANKDPRLSTREVR